MGGGAVLSSMTSNRIPQTPSPVQRHVVVKDVQKVQQHALHGIWC